jgi:anti-anti-sigma regulatory factor
MLRIAIADLPDEQRWSLQGQLVGQSKTELKSTWRKACDQRDTRRCIVELIEVTSIDRSGEIILAEMLSQGAEFISRATCTQSIFYGNCAAN